MFKVGQKVWCVVYGEGVVTEVDDENAVGSYGVLVKFKNGHSVNYASDGRWDSFGGNVALFPYPVEIVKATVKPWINWSHVSERFRYLAMDEGGRCWLWESEPAPFGREWSGGGKATKAESFASFTPGTCDWRDSLVKRPE